MGLDKGTKSPANISLMFDKYLFSFVLRYFKFMYLCRVAQHKPHQGKEGKARVDALLSQHLLSSQSWATRPFEVLEVAFRENLLDGKPPLVSPLNMIGHR